MNKTLSILTAIAICSTSARAFDFSDILNWTGTGANESAVVIDWHDGTATDEFAWGYRWNGAANGEQMLLAIAAANSNLTVTTQSFSFGDAVDDIHFDGTAYGYGVHDWSGFASGSNGFWDYYTSSGPAAGNWTESGVGFSDRSLSNQSWDGWSWAANFTSIQPDANILAAPQSVPEPVELPFIVTLLAGATTQLRRSRR